MSATNKLLDNIKSPRDLRLLSESDLVKLSTEIRTRITEVVGINGGHLASNLGIVELTLALHRVFDFSSDYLVFDVGHQCYVHKLLTGRNERFNTLRTKGGITGFPNPQESNYDVFVSGHAATSISSTLGLAIASRLQGEDRAAVAVIGDGSICGGPAFEALNHAGHVKENIIVILNDNEMAIAQTVGALSGYLARIRSDPTYHRLREDLKNILQRIPFVGSQLDWLHEAIIDGVKQVIEPGHIFSELGFSYYGPLDGHNIPLLIENLENLRRLPGPKFLHVVTKKGNGFHAAAENPEKFHSTVPFEVLPGGEVVAKKKKRETYTAAFSQALLTACENNKKIVAITAAMPAGTGLAIIAKKFPERYIDVGISEEHAVILAGGLARGGSKPILVIYSTFAQRSYDEFFHDICLQKDLGVIFAIDRAGLVGVDGPTHHGVFDIAMLRHLPNMTLLAPRDGNELKLMLQFALTLKQPIAIRYPRAYLPEVINENYKQLKLGSAELLKTGEDAIILAYGEMVNPAYQAALQCQKEGLELSVVNLRFAKPLDQKLLLELADKHKIMITVEDGVINGGVGSAVMELLAKHNKLPAKFLQLGIPDRYIEHGSREELFKDLNLDLEGLVKTFKKAVTSLTKVKT